jgi:hypothetical protein
MKTTLAILVCVAAGTLSACVVVPVDDGRNYPTQRHGRDRDRDGIPDRMDRDRDGDGVPNRVDRRPDNPRR